MNKKTNRIKSAILAGALSLSLAGCGGSTKEETNTPSEPTAIEEVVEETTKEVTPEVTLKEKVENLTITKEDLDRVKNEIITKYSSQEALDFVKENKPDDYTLYLDYIKNENDFEKIIELSLIEANCESLRKNSPEIIDNFIAEGYYKNGDVASTVNILDLYNDASFIATNEIFKNSFSLSEFVFDEEEKEVIIKIEDLINEVYQVSEGTHPNSQLTVREIANKNFPLIEENMNKLPYGIATLLANKIYLFLGYTKNITMEALDKEDARWLYDYGYVNSSIDKKLYYTSIKTGSIMVPNMRESIYGSAPGIYLQAAKYYLNGKSADAYCNLYYSMNDILKEYPNALYFDPEGNMNLDTMNQVYIFNNFYYSKEDKNAINNIIMNAVSDKNPSTIMSLGNYASINVYNFKKGNNVKPILASDFMMEGKDKEQLLKMEEEFSKFYNLTGKEYEEALQKFTDEFNTPFTEMWYQDLSAGAALAFIFVDYYTLLSKCDVPENIIQDFIIPYPVDQLGRLQNLEYLVKDQWAESYINEICGQLMENKYMQATEIVEEYKLVLK